MIKRPLVFCITVGLVGLIGGTLYIEHIQGLPIFFILVFICSLICGYYFGKKGLMIFVISCFMGIICFCFHPTVREARLFEDGQVVHLEGIVADVNQNEYSQNLVLKTVRLETQKIKSRVQVVVDLQTTYDLGDKITLTGKVETFPIKMNPSDFNYGYYLKAQNIVAVVKTQSIYQGADEGVMEAALIGNGEALDDEVQELYSAVGIGHVLCVSGFHVGLVVSFLLSTTTFLSYTKRYIVSTVGIWVYCILTGMAASTVRAGIMATLIMGARILWEEEDFWTSIAISGLINLAWRPYQIFSIGFQLSYMAVISIGISQIYLKKYHYFKGWKRTIISTIIPWFLITLTTSPIIAYHYFEIPFLGSVLNLFILPLFSLLIILGWMTLGLCLVGVPTIVPFIKGITTLLGGIHLLCQAMLQLPLGTLCVGRPSWITLIVYYVLLGVIGLKFYGKPFHRSVKIGIYIGVISYLSICFLIPQDFKLTCLYVGQGDGSVLETPHRQFVVIDGGNFGKGKTVMNYIKSRGKKEIAALVVSHGDSDHVGGIIEILESDFKVARVIVSSVECSEHMTQVSQLCSQKHIPLLRLEGGDQFVIDKTRFEVLAPFTDQGDLNNNSLVCLVSYGRFKALFTGDKEKESESFIYNHLSSIDFLKVSHHGSKTGTEEKLLLKLKPQYAMISCGTRNRYGHPHKEVLEALEMCHVPYGRTDLQGAIWVCTNGKSMTLYTQREEM